MPPDSFLQRFHPEATAQELPALRRTYWPNVPVVFQTYHLMIGIGVALLALALAGCFLWWRGWLFRTDWWVTRWFLIAAVFSVLGPQIANQAGWFTAEMGRQPWIVYELLKTSEALSKVVTANQIAASLVLFALVYTLLFILFIYLLTRKIQHGPDEAEESGEMPDSWKAVLRRDDQEARI